MPTHWVSIDAIQRATGPKEVYQVEGATHVDSYEVDEHVSDAVARLTRFYRENLG
ncbi:hypothetical protein [Catenulispora subtropica]|uniref:Alpha/beta hydrolase n=1 Tax=Catenulispora subtropica TaxID=450798 RepID=A0ABP5DYU5_9ACTN